MPDVNPIPEGCAGLIPHLVVKGGDQAIEFYRKAFGATELGRSAAPGSDKIMHAALKIGESTVFLCDDFPEFCGGKERHPGALGGSPVTIHQYVEDVDAAMKRAEEAGATVTMPAENMFWGDRYGTLKDPFGHSWSFATHIKDVSPDELEQATNAAFSGSER